MAKGHAEHWRPDAHPKGQVVYYCFSRPKLPADWTEVSWVVVSPKARICCILRTQRIGGPSTLRAQWRAGSRWAWSRPHWDQGHVCNIGLYACVRPNELVIDARSWRRRGKLRNIFHLGLAWIASRRPSFACRPLETWPFAYVATLSSDCWAPINWETSSCTSHNSTHDWNSMYGNWQCYCPAHWWASLPPLSFWPRGGHDGRDGLHYHWPSFCDAFSPEFHRCWTFEHWSKKEWTWNL